MPNDLEEPTYADIHYLPNTREPNEQDFRALVFSFPIIDNHAHNLLREEEAHGNTDYPFESVTSEAQGHALQEHVQSTLAHIRAIRQLAEFYDCPPTLHDVKARRYNCAMTDYDGLIRKCLQGTHALLLDDGLPQESVYPVQRHKEFAPTVRRIARIEAVAADLLEQLARAAGLLTPGVDGEWPIEKSEAFLVRFNTMFRNQIKNLAADPLVCGFKSVVCYRSGLDVSLVTRNAFRPHQSLADSALLTSFHQFLKNAVAKDNYRVEAKPVNDFLVVAACDVLEKLVETEGETFPIQFHTGLGDVDIDLVKANPAYMQPLIQAFPNVDFVILHSSYPYTREAGYLAANFANAWLDVGEVFPMLARHGQQSVIRQALELTPASKILWSTDGHFYPETFYLANLQFRQALEVVLSELIAEKDITVMQAINMAVEILFWNSNSLYKLDEERKYPQLLRACGRTDGGSSRTTLVNHESDTSLVHIVPDVAQASANAGAGLASARSTTVFSPASQRCPDSESSSHRQTSRDKSRPISDPFTDPESTATMSDTEVSRPDRFKLPAAAGQLELIDEFLKRNKDVKYIWLQFLSNTGTVRCRMVPVKQFRKQVASGQMIGITKALPRLLANEWPAEGCIATGEFKMLPDLKTLCLNKGIDSPSASVQTWWIDGVGDDQFVHNSRCPRWTLQRQVDTLETQYGLQIIAGFEIEIIFTRPVTNDTASDYEDFQILREVHSWSNLTQMQLEWLGMIEEIVQTLSEIGIELEQFHAEAAPSQWEFPLPPANPVEAVDRFYKAKDTICNVASKYGLKATVYPRPYETAPGSAAHMHFSINGKDGTVEQYSDSFLAGVLEHLPSILAFSLSLEESYARIAPGVWAGGQWVTWGTQNREAPLRKCGPGHWEMKTSDGTGNAYLSMAAVLAAGLNGLDQKLDLKQKDTLVPADTLTDQERAEHGITTMLPNTLTKSLKCLKEDEALTQLLGDDIVEDYIAVKEAEMAFLNNMVKQKRKIWLMARH